MTIFLDTANVSDIVLYKNWGIIKGVTTNQKIFLKTAKEEMTENSSTFINHVKKILRYTPNLPVSVELTKTRKIESPIIRLVEEAMKYKNLEKKVKNGGKVVIKVPMWGDGFGLVVAKQIAGAGVPVNMTCCMSVNQAILACELDVTYVSLFYNRIMDYAKVDRKDLYPGRSGKCVIETTRRIIELQGYKTKIIAGSIRNPVDVCDCFEAGAHIVTVTPEVLKQLPLHPKTEETIKEFDEAWKKFTGESR